MSKYRITDERARSTMKEKVIYQLYLRSFTEEGTVNAAYEKLEHLASLGIDVIYFAAFCEADENTDRDTWSPRQIKSGINNPKNPYRICDYFMLDPEYGTMDDLKRFVDKAHSLGMLVMCDLVYLHCGPGKFVDEHPNFVCRDENGEVITNNWNFPLINYENPELREYLWENMRFWAVDMGMDGFRCDVGDRVPLDFWREGRRRIDAIKPNFLMLNEGDLPSFVEDVFDANYDFTWSSVLKGVIKGGEEPIELLGAYQFGHAKNPDGALVLRAFENHDTANDAYENRLDKSFSENVNTALVVNFMLDGVPFIYNGNEIADATRHSIWSLKGDPYHIDWSLTESERGKKRLALIRRLTELRHSEQALINGKTVWTKDPVLTIFERRTALETVRVIVNFSKFDASASIKGGTVLIDSGATVRGRKVFLKSGGYYVEKITKAEV